MVPPPLPSPSSPNAQYTQEFLYSLLSQTQQFLYNVLSRRGPSALPYNEDVNWLILQHLVALVDAYRSLQLKTATFTHNDGRTVKLLQADGTVPMVYNDVTYNIPIIVWLMESYPRHAPLVFVNPTRDMVIKRPHSFVNPSGVVAIPYLQNWVYPSSNLVELARNLSHFFARDPPLYSRPQPNPKPNPNPNPNPNPSTSFSNNNYNSSNSKSRSKTKYYVFGCCSGDTSSA